MERMNCWRTTWGATLANVGKVLWSLSLGEGSGVSPLHSGVSKEALGWLFIAGLILHAVGTQWLGMASADQREVKRQLRLKADGTPYESTPAAEELRAAIGLGTQTKEQAETPRTLPSNNL